MPEYSIGVDLGGTNLRAAAISSDGRDARQDFGKDTAFRRTRRSHRRHRGGDQSLCGIDAPASSLAGVGIGVPGFIEIEKGMMLGSNNLPEFEGFPVRERHRTPPGNTGDSRERRQRGGARRKVDRRGARRERPGSADARHRDRRRHHLGRPGAARFYGHGRRDRAYHRATRTANPCGCGNTGCLEKHASATAIGSMARLMSIGDNLTSEDVYNLALAGDKAREDDLSIHGDGARHRHRQPRQHFQLSRCTCSAAVRCPRGICSPPR